MKKTISILLIPLILSYEDGETIVYILLFSVLGLFTDKVWK